jgi:hypothetical protein
LTVSFGPGRAWLRRGSPSAIPAVAAAVRARKRRRFIGYLPDRNEHSIPS